ncbi:hypothetical protein HUT18_11845 [Streptomyces sp. NA04227]|uniref:hypothetical protein n=1 Tax=Streptomyces sp. NA04227 TaxID=2742136 RepID=UPI001591D603|nr:hypothetical protein [Streptomyces sp. NA04227]QKW06991.1 hypothetical protein HUT18_11845 [Streptomyces sp. NA04227]
MNHDTTTATRKRLPEEVGEQQLGSELPPYSGELTVCTKCSYNEAFTRYRPESPRGLWDYNGRTKMRGPLPERLERSCQRCDFQWDEALRPADGVRPLAVAELAYALTRCAPYSVSREAADSTAARLLDVAYVLLRPEHPMWNQPPACPPLVHDQAAQPPDPKLTSGVPIVTVPDAEPMRQQTPPAGSTLNEAGSEQ